MTQNDDPSGELLLESFLWKSMIAQNRVQIRVIWTKCKHCMWGIRRKVILEVWMYTLNFGRCYFHLKSLWAQLWGVQQHRNFGFLEKTSHAVLAFSLYFKKIPTIVPENEFGGKWLRWKFPRWANQYPSYFQLKDHELNPGQSSDAGRASIIGCFLWYLGGNTVK